MLNPGQKSVVGVERVADISSGEGIARGTAKLLDLVCAGLPLKPEATVVIKLNLCLLKGHETGATIDPRVAQALIAWLKERHRPRRIILAESDATHLSADMAFRILGWEEVFRGVPGVEFLNLSKDETVPVKSRAIKDLTMPKTMMEADLLVSLAKLKTHTQQKITCIMKNQFGAIPYKYKIVYHPILTEAIVDATAARLPDLSLIDGLIAMEGNGPTNGTPRNTRLLVASRDAVATDHFCARLMGFRPGSIPHLALALKLGLGSARYDLVGSPPEPINQRFRFLPGWKKNIKLIIGLAQRGAVNEEA